ncbi:MULTISPECIES: ABC transporter ATP-binding protein [unclassified Bacteroides]|jgi:osmoprotectant transport system ATP-binding protein|uniref:ATP-binding cassette domain-containing protein n=1 Tax=unclassified Bacteroides TaxID=2646097 RepID=UPI000E9354B8|nr:MULTISPECIES: ABC transporter ATP-binding protein [unclassified Bacteroides]RGN46320.1 ABC transporter ATP-binding protein [Bacteroides sp. OM05-12]RHR74786.1 ABC transporter ATP-binding protein [Bacteroides sp. AF16-49]
MRTDAIIRFDHVSKSYGENLVLADFNLSINKGEFVTVIGSSGSGKTTMLKMINGLLTPTLGTIYVDGKDIARENQTLLRRNIGYVIQGIGLFPHMNVRKNIAYVPELLNRRDKKRTARAVERLIEVVGLEREMLERYPAELSGGQRQRIGIARALAANPEILLMDEPFGAVDEITRKMLQNEIARIHQTLGVTIVFITHDIKEALKLGTRILVMNKGKVEQDGTPEEITLSPATAFVKELVQIN